VGNRFVSRLVPKDEAMLAPPPDCVPRDAQGILKCMNAKAERYLIKMVQRIREEFEQMPGLRLTVSEASRFWALDECVCGAVLARLLSNGFLLKDGEQRFAAA
jgi:hypothetical protein